MGRFKQYIIDEAKTAKNAENFEWMIAQLLYFYSNSKENDLYKLFDERSNPLSNNESDDNFFYKNTFVSKYKDSTIKAVEHLLKWKKSFKQICNLGNTVRCMGKGNVKSPGGSPKADLIIDKIGISVKLSGDVVAASAQSKENFQQIFLDGLKWFISAEGRQPLNKSGESIIKEYKESIKFIRENLIGEIKKRFVDLTVKKNYDKMFSSAIKKSSDPEKIKSIINDLVNIQSKEIKNLNNEMDKHTKFMKSEIRKKSVDTLNGIFKGPDGIKLKMYIVAEQMTGWNKYKGKTGCATHLLSPDGFYEMIDSKGKPNEMLLHDIASRTTFNFRGLPKNRTNKLTQLESLYKMGDKEREKAMESFFDMAHGMKADVKKVKTSSNEGKITDFFKNFANKIKIVVMKYYNLYKTILNKMVKSLDMLSKKEDKFLNKEINSVEDIIKMV